MAQTAAVEQSRGMRAAFRVFSAIERIGNLLPHPFWLFCILSGVVIVLSAALEAAGFPRSAPARATPSKCAVS
ncbi:AbgT family transporter [Arthrobacter sp. ATA002]|uniref:AbgT family transporter n=1 Tax=Arthrobacter sp. ATA002 TaxID=2991715 RepID=UPI0022A6E5C7|nr:AbgT family transporter [Arthrobacter sp. ATA002]WAP52602.1 AbgT family transporter [Arthrobacter sp. ATA002]